MIVVDTSALMAILFNEAAKPSCLDVLFDAGLVCISAATLTEALIVSEGRGVGAEMTMLIESFVDEIVLFDAVPAYRAADAHARWGKGRHRARLNFGDCFAYALAKSRDLPLLYVVRTFARRISPPPPDARYRRVTAEAGANW